MGTVNLRLTNCIADIVAGEYMPQTITVNVTATSGYKFQTTPYIYWSYLSDHGRPIYGSYEMNRVSETIYEYPLEIKETPDYYITAEAVKNTVILDKYGLITVYRVTTDELRDISKKRWQKWDVSGPTVGETTNPYIDTAQYVVHLLKLYIDVATDTKEKLYFGPYDMGMECDVVSTDIVKLDLGTVTINGVYGNAIDYENSEIQAYLPFIGFVSLSPDDFMDKTVSLHYQINVINGDALAVFTCDGNVVQSLSCNVSFEVPYQLTGSELISKGIQPNTNYLLDQPAFIYVKTHKSVNPTTDLPYHDTKFYSKFGDLTGYTEAKEVDFTVLSDHITKTEIDEIITLLENGVFL